MEHAVVKQICLGEFLLYATLFSLGSQFAFLFRIYRISYLFISVFGENGYEFPFLFCVCIAFSVTGETDLQLSFPVFC